MSVTLRPK